MFWTFKANKGDIVAGESRGNAFDNFGLVFNTIIPTSHQTLVYQMEGPHMSSTHAHLCWVFSYWPRVHISAPPLHHSNIIVKFANNTTVLCLICGADVTANRQEVRKLVTWSSVVNLLRNTSKTKKMVMAWKKNRAAHDPGQINSVLVGRDSFFFGVHVADVLAWHTNTTAVSAEAAFLKDSK